ncbi:MAG: hypothetical protein FWH08_03190 [Oscillospiraceae bacterium]|nr:hypothetical protein [Oscillospiraceae bacterium]
MRVKLSIKADDLNAPLNGNLPPAEAGKLASDSSPVKKIRLKLGKEKIKKEITGEQAQNLLGRLYEDLEAISFSVQSGENSESDAGYAAVNMFLELFGKKLTEKLLLLCKENPESSERIMKKLKRVIKCGLYPLAKRQRRLEDRRGVKKYL